MASVASVAVDEMTRTAIDALLMPRDVYVQRLGAARSTLTKTRATIDAIAGSDALTITSKAQELRRLMNDERECVADVRMLEISVDALTGFLVEELQEHIRVPAMGLEALR